MPLAFVEISESKAQVLKKYTQNILVYNLDDLNLQIALITQESGKTYSIHDCQSRAYSFGNFVATDSGKTR